MTEMKVQVSGEVPSEVLSEVRGQVGFITLNRPRALNALSLSMVRCSKTSSPRNTRSIT